MIISCRHCHHAVADDAPQCPHCGGQPYERFRPVRDTAIFLLLAFAAAWYSGATNNQLYAMVFIPICLAGPFIKMGFAKYSRDRQRAAPIID